MGSPSRSCGRVARRRWALLALALILPPVLLRGCLFATYAVRSRSMEPAFVEGDRLLVLQRGADTRELQRWDAVVLSPEVDGEMDASVDAVLKRVVGLPGEWLRIAGGDVLVGASLDALAPAPRRACDLLVPLHQGDGLQPPWTWLGPGEIQALPGGGTRIVAGPVPGVAVYETRLRDGLPGEPGEEAVADTALEVSVGAGAGTLELRLREGADVFTARLPGPGQGVAVLHHNLASPSGVVAWAEGRGGLAPGASVRMANVDNRVRLWVDGVEWMTYSYAANETPPPGGETRNEPEVGVVDGMRVLRRVIVLRDLHYAEQGTFGSGAAGPYRVPPGHVFVLGDHSRQSRDSRFYGAVPLSAALGRPLAVYLPRERSRWLTAER